FNEDYVEQPSFDYAAHEARLDATDETAQVMKHRIDAGMLDFTRDYGGALDLPHKPRSGESKASCAGNQDAAKHEAMLDKWVELAASVPLPLPNVAELDFLAWRKADCTVSSRLKPVFHQTLGDGEDLAFPEQAALSQATHSK
ncbi:hypothetical protein LTR53_019561, partial [Teratosphaeriaceae sp. CCFEE 6253]